jgi:hypothetical protein
VDTIEFIVRVHTTYEFTDRDKKDLYRILDKVTCQFLNDVICEHPDEDASDCYSYMVEEEE